MTATAQNATIYEGEYKRLPFGPVTDVNGDVVSLSGATLEWRMCESDGPTGTALLTKTSAGSTIVIDSPATDGTGYIIIATGDTTGMGEGNYYHEMVITKSSQPEVAFTGTITIHKSNIL